jgi:hypothetical protein
MARRSPRIACEDVPLDEAHRMGRGSRMNPELHHALREKIRSLDTMATRVIIPEGTNPNTMKNRILRVAAELGMPVTIRKVPGGLIFWRSSDDDVQQAKEVAARLPSARQPQPATRRGRRRRT